jgi:hypothetical protein
LESSLTNPELGEEALLSDTGTVRINVKHSREATDQSTKKRHRIFTDVPHADVKPPEEVPVILLHSVRFRMDIVTVKSRSNIEKNVSTETQTAVHEIRRPIAKEDLLTNHDSNDEIDVLLMEESDEMPPTPVPGITDDALNGERKDQTRKRSLPYVDDAVQAQNWDIQSNKRSRRECESIASLPAVEDLIDSAMRLSICRGPVRLASGVKTITSTFTHTLSDVAPALWSPGYLPVVQIRPLFRAHFTDSRRHFHRGYV